MTLAHSLTSEEIDEAIASCGGDPTLLRDMARQLMPDWFKAVYRRMVDPEIPAGTLLAIGDRLIKVGDLEPKKEAQVAQQGAKFGITINIPGIDGKPPVTIQAMAVEEIEGVQPKAIAFDGNEDLMAEDYA